MSYSEVAKKDENEELPIALKQKLKHKIGSRLYFQKTEPNYGTFFFLILTRWYFSIDF